MKTCLVVCAASPGQRADYIMLCSSLFCLLSVPLLPPSSYHCPPFFTFRAHPSHPLVPHSSLNSVNSSDSRSSGSHSHSPSSHYRYRSSNLTQQAPVRLSSVSSHDSGFISQDAFQSKSPSPMPPEAPNQVRVPLAPGAAVTPGALTTVNGWNQRSTLA